MSNPGPEQKWGQSEAAKTPQAEEVEFQTSKTSVQRKKETTKQGMGRHFSHSEVWGKRKLRICECPRTPLVKSKVYLDTGEQDSLYLKITKGPGLGEPKSEHQWEGYISAHDKSDNA